jgi:hypothetical protein
MYDRIFTCPVPDEKLSRPMPSERCTLNCESLIVLVAHLLPFFPPFFLLEMTLDNIRSSKI